MRTLVSILNWNNTLATNTCLAGIAKMPHAQQPDIYVIDNDSQREKLVINDDTAKKLRSLKIFYNKTNKGFAGGHNDAVAYAIQNRYDYVCLLNNDTEIIDLDIFTKLTGALSRDNSAVAAAPTILGTKVPPTIWFGGGSMNIKHASTRHSRLNEVVSTGDSTDVQQVSFLTGCCLMISLRDPSLNLKLDEDYFLYYEDADWCARMQLKNKSLLYVPSTQLLHATSSSLGIRSPSYAYYNVRNRLLFAKKWSSIIRVLPGTLWNCFKIIGLSFKRPSAVPATIWYTGKALLHGLSGKVGPIK